MKFVANQACETCKGLATYNHVLETWCYWCFPCEKYGICKKCCVYCSKCAMRSSRRRYEKFLVDNLPISLEQLFKYQILAIKIKRILKRCLEIIIISVMTIILLVSVCIILLNTVEIFYNILFLLINGSN